MALPRHVVDPNGHVLNEEERTYHESFMREAIGMAELALQTDETPVGCVFVKDGEIIGRGMNATNRTLNGTRHAEFIALAEILSKHPISILQETDLYVTVEPCVMCASALRQYHIRAVYFGCWNDRFGGTGGVLTIHSDPSVDKPYPVYGGIFREEAILLLRKFYVQENEKAPEPKQKKTRELKTEILPLEMVNPDQKAKKLKGAKKENVPVTTTVFAAKETVTVSTVTSTLKEIVAVDTTISTAKIFQQEKPNDQNPGGSTVSVALESS
ncbi:cytidine deaminase-like protein [Delitschia confertaspora ATCC 74209]|uniref:tRNA(adenine(34)) deaminase n=1 Tax=Delitschia confertaspora ATCC 74209 TaxID=1513339 RepID=A0A9P4K0R2_9PLEO|nr:cytidine deaminase-like protein [Delitschia confertaspora ATCC 74209]